MNRHRAPSRHWASGLSLVAAALLATLAACGGGGVDFPAPQVVTQQEQQRQATAAQATELTQSLRQAVAQAVASGQPLATVQNNFGPQPVPLPSGSTITAVRVEFGGTIVADVSLPLPPAGSAQAPAATIIDTALPPNTPGRGQLLWVAYPAATGVLRWYCFGSYPSAPQDTGGACLYPGDSARGMSWGTANGPAAGGLPPYDATYNISLVECNVITPPTAGRSGAPQACDPYQGDWHVLRKLPLLCVRQDGRAAPAGWAPVPGTRPFVGGEVAVTPPVYGIRLLGRAPGDQLCEQQFGSGWIMSAFHDGGGWGYYGTGRTPTDTRFWVRITDQPANPWCATLTGLPCQN
jgi:predicted small lipoprotein YifL